MRTTKIVSTDGHTYLIDMNLLPYICSLPNDYTIILPCLDGKSSTSKLIPKELSINKIKEGAVNAVIYEINNYSEKFCDNHNTKLEDETENNSQDNP